MLRALAAVGSLLVLTAAGSAVLAAPAGAAGPSIFSPQSFWNAPLGASARIDPNSGAMVRGLVAEVNSELSRRYGPWINTKEYSTPVYTVGPAQPTVRVTLDRGAAELQQAVAAVPIPAGARPAPGTDRHMVVWQPATDTMWEFWKMEMRSDGWRAGAAGAMRGVSTNPGYFTPEAWLGAQPWWGATATGLPLFGGLMTIAELQRGRIDHALALAIPHPRAKVWSWPATRTDGDSRAPNSLPEGARLRLDPTLNLKKLNLPPVTRMMAEAAQRYGIVIRDSAGVVAFYGEDPSTARSNPYPKLYGNQYPDQLLAKFPWRSLQVLKLDLRGSG
jgi:hypothetical protein